MPRLKATKSYPDIDWLLASILERKKIMGLQYEDLASAAKISPQRMRSLMASKPPEEWPRDVRIAVCRKLGINAKLVITTAHEVDV